MSNVTENLGLSYGEVKDERNNHPLTGATHLDEKDDDVVPVPATGTEVNVGVVDTHTVTVARVEPALDDADTQQAVDTRDELHPQHENQSSVPQHPEQLPEDGSNLQTDHDVHVQPTSDEPHSGASSSMPRLHLSPAPSEALLPYTSPSAPDSNGLAVRRRGAERYHPTSTQLKTLMASFEENPCPSVTTLNQLSTNINMPMHNLVLWFKNKRARSKKNNVRLPGQRRSYVKSGIYSKARRASAPESGSKQEQEPVLHSHLPNTELAPPLSLPSAEPSQSCHADDAHNESVCEPQFDTVPQNLASSRLISSPSASIAQVRPQTQLPNAKRHRANRKDDADGGKMAAFNQNPCRNWSSLKCLQTFIIFFNRHTSGQHHDQLKAAEAIATEFFISEMQSGLTVSSLVQPIKTSMEILDRIINKRTEQGLAPLSSGSRSILGEFIVQIRSGEASSFDLQIN